MTDYRTMFDRDYIGAWSLVDGKDVTITITKVTGGTLTGQGGRKTRKPVIFMHGTDKGLALNVTNCKTIAGLYGNHVEEWVGKRVTLFKAQTQFGSETMDCIRIRPRVPPPKGQKDEGKLSSEPPPPPPEQFGDEEQADAQKSASNTSYSGTTKMLLAKIKDCLSERSLGAVLGDYAEELKQIESTSPNEHAAITAAIDERKKHFAR